MNEITISYEKDFLGSTGYADTRNCPFARALKRLFPEAYATSAAVSYGHLYIKKKFL